MKFFPQATYLLATDKYIHASLSSSNWIHILLLINNLKPYVPNNMVGGALDLIRQLPKLFRRDGRVDAF